MASRGGEEAGLLFMVDGVVLICEIQGCGRSKVMMKDNSTRPQSANRFYEMRSYYSWTLIDQA
jgi:hypothetical protein